MNVRIVKLDIKNRITDNPYRTVRKICTVRDDENQDIYNKCKHSDEKICNCIVFCGDLTQPNNFIH